MFVLVLNASNIVEDGKNSTLVYNFPNSILLKDKFIAVSQVVMYYSWFNINITYNNNTLTYVWYNGATPTTYTITIPNGLYNISDINSFCQFTMIANGHYLINASGDYVYYFEITVNANRYAIQLNTFYVPLSLPIGWTQPSNFGGYPTTRYNPIVSFPNYFSGIVGYEPIGGVVFSSNLNSGGSYTPPTPSASTYYATKDGANTLSYLSNVAPNVQPNSSVYLSISNINNPYSQPSSILYAITPTVAIGEQVVEKPPNFMWCKMIDGTYNQLRVQILGIDKQPLTIADKNMTIILSIRDKEEGFLGGK